MFNPSMLHLPPTVSVSKSFSMAFAGQAGPAVGGDGAPISGTGVPAPGLEGVPDGAVD